jgi:hypothetical protein
MFVLFGTNLAKMVQNRFFLFLVIVIVVPACKIDRKKTVDRDKFTFRVSDDSFLFFRNVRQIYYDVQDLHQAHWYAYRFGDRPVDPQRPIINPVIVVDWMKSESYVLIEPNEVLADESVLTIRETTRAGTTLEYSLGQRGRANMLEFATKIYEGIMDENKIFIRRGENFAPLFIDDEERESYRIVMSDYYRLTRIF